MGTDQIPAEEIAEQIDQTIQTLATMDPKSFWTMAKEFMISLLPTLISAVLILLVGLILIRITMSFTKKMFEKSKLDPTLHAFTLSIIRTVLYFLLCITVLAILLPSAVSGLIAALGVFGLAVSLAVKDSLSNVAGGLSVLFTKPFSLGDYVKIGGDEGTIREIRLNYTVLTTVDNKTVHIPNGDVAKALIVNYTGQETRRLDLEFSIGYGDDFEKAKAIIRKVAEAHPKAIQDPEPVIRMVSQGESAIVLCCRTWTKTADYWPLYFDMLEQVKTAFDREGINIPYNQLDVHLVK